MSQMRTIEVEGKTFEWKAGKRFIRIRGNGRVADIELSRFVKDETAIVSHPYDFELESYYTGRNRFFAITPGDVRAYVEKHGWLQ